MRKPQVLVGIQMILFTIMVALVVALPSTRSTVTNVAGLLLMLLGASIGLAAISQHPGGPNVSPEPKRNGQLIQTGLYRWIRHPIYTSVLTGALGMAVIHGHPATYLLFIVFVVFFSVKSRYEEGLLQAQFADYVTYMQHTGRFLPPRRS